MFQNLAKFFIENNKLTLILVMATFIIGIASYFGLAKQYNPTIVVPSFYVSLGAPGLSSDEVEKYITSEVENKVMELEGIDEVQGVSGNEFSGIMVKFHVGVDKESAKIRLQQKLQENRDLSPLGISYPIIKSIDPEELSQITFALSTSQDISEEEKYIYLRQIGEIIKEKVKTIPGVTTIQMVGGYQKNILINIDPKTLAIYGIDILQVYNQISENYQKKDLGNFHTKTGENISLSLNGKKEGIEILKKLTLKNTQGELFYLGDIAEVRYGIQRIDTHSKINGNESVFLGFGKQVGFNSVKITQNIKNTVKELQKELPKDIQIDTIQDEGKTAQGATNMLMINLFQSILIVVIVLGFALGFKNALNVAISIPLTLFSVFTVALIFGENINRITLFALILVLGMLVDDATVVVENINRHLELRFKKGKTKLVAIMDAIKEVQLGVILSTVTRLFAFGAMFFVTGMMGEYMGPIPKFALIASVFSTFIALTVNPWMSYYLQKDTQPSEENRGVPKKENHFVRKWYLGIMEKFLGDEKEKKQKRKKFRILFWILFFLVIVVPIYGGIFKARMLPKSDQNQIYIWIDAPRGWSIEKMKQVETDLETFLQKEEMIQFISYTTGQSFVDDFANLFRGGNMRNGEYQLSARINLWSPEVYKEKFGSSRESSEIYTIDLRKRLEPYLGGNFPDLKIKLLEDPPGPPVSSTFLAKIKSNASEKNIQAFLGKVQKEIEMIGPKEKLVDLYNTIPTTYKKTQLIVDHYALQKNNASVQNIIDTLSLIFSGKDIAISQNTDSREITYIQIQGKDIQENNPGFLDTLLFYNNQNEAIPLRSIIQKQDTFVKGEIYTDKREQYYGISAEMGENSLVYPQVKLIKVLLGDSFIKDEYFLKSWNLYEIVYIGKTDGKEYKIEWGGEWKLILDTFRDLGIAMIIALLGIYLLLVGQFKSFKVSGIIMLAFLLGFFGVFPGFTLLYLFSGEYFSATSMIGVIALAGIVVGNSILLVEYIYIMKENRLSLKDALLQAGYTRFKPIILTSLTTVLGAFTIIGDPVWSGLAWAIIWGLSLSALLTLIVIPIFYYDSQRGYWED